MLNSNIFLKGVLLLNVFPPASLMAQILGIFAPEFEDLSVILNGLQGLLGSGPQLLLQITFYFYGIIDLNPYNSPLQAVNFLLGVVIVGRSVVMYDILYKEGTTSNREVAISLSKKFGYCIQVCSAREEM